MYNRRLEGGAGDTLHGLLHRHDVSLPGAEVPGADVTAHRQALQLPPNDMEPDNFSQEERRTSEYMINYWVNFAKNGNPNYESGLQWTTVNGSEKV